ncbi:MAG: hypothetical protein JW809_13930 [Pirellulales bacterium]|nr:hypothetical protein [Pirellulales bacterium]
MSILPDISYAEWALLVELLEREQNTLPEEIDHSGLAHVKVDLEQRLETVDNLLERLQAVGCPEYADAT